MQLLKPVDYKLKVHTSILRIHLCSNFNYEHDESCIGITWRDLIMEAEVFDRSAELSIVTGSSLDPKKYWYVLTKS